MARPTNSSKITLLQSGSENVAPDFVLEAGELAINRFDNKLFYENVAGTGNTTVFLPTQAVNSTSTPTFAELTVDSWNMNGSTLTKSGSNALVIDASHADSEIQFEADSGDFKFTTAGNNRLQISAALVESSLTSHGGMKLITGSGSSNAFNQYR